MTSKPSARRFPEVALAFAAGVASFAIIAVALAVLEAGILAAILGAACVAAIIAIARRWGVAYAVPAAMAGLLAYDWYQFPPTHAEEFPSSGNLANLITYLAVSVLVGELAASAARRAEVSEREAARLADEQAALRRVATLVARGVPPSEVFAAVAQEVGRLLDVDTTYMGRYEGDGTMTGVGNWSRAGEEAPAETRVTLDGRNVSSLVAQTRQPARMDSYDDATGSIVEMLRELGIRSSVGAPIIVDESLWGVMVASSKAEAPLPADTESRIAAFTELVATALSNTEARVEVRRLAEEQAALRRVATLVAHGVPSSDLFGTVAGEVGRLLGTDLAGMVCYGADDSVSVVATWAAAGDEVEAGDRWPLDGGDLAMTILESGRPSRIRSSVGSPIVVEGRLWGALFVHSTHSEPLPADTESRLTNFTELVGTAISNAQAREEVHRLADEQAALRRVATLVAREPPPGEVFATVAEEVARLLDVEDVKIERYEADGTVTFVADWSEPGFGLPIGTRVPLGGRNIISHVHRTGRPARIDDYATATGAAAAAARGVGIRSAVGSPIVVDGRLWGAVIASSRRAEPLPAGTELRIGEFTELVATAISNIEARSELAESRARIVAAADQERRRVVRDLHDGAQQRLVHTVITLKLARSALERGDDAALEHVTVALDNAEHTTSELRELAHGILPSVLTHGGLHAGVESLASRMPVPVDYDVAVGRLPAPVEATAYFVVAEALTNVAKHAHAGQAAVEARVEEGMLRLHVRDDGVGGARPDGSGLVGLRDRLAVLDGRLRVESPADGGTLVDAAIPLGVPAHSR